MRTLLVFAAFAPGMVVPLRPFFGSMGVITQLVDGNVGVHVKMPKEIFR